ncbi:MAG TPA: xanthine dehydrogenase family protein subunit M [Tepidisphaeraceae bacterium]|nr:xanthine dehydrogenase family protein subunit M [Tepidisphaeraceae bacterium]
MKSFEWFNPTSVDEAIAQLSVGLNADDSQNDPYESPRPLAGGQDLLTTMKEYLLRPPRVVNLKQISGLDKIEGDARSGLKIGALVKLVQLIDHPEIKASFTGLSEAAQSIATPQVRNMGTAGGNLCQRPRCWYFRMENVICLKKGGDTCYAEKGQNKYHAIFAGGPSYIVHPSDLAPMLIALGASVTIASAGGKRRDVPLDQFFTLPSIGDPERENILTMNEIVTAINVPAAPSGGKSTYLKFKERESQDFALASVAANLTTAPDGTVSQARLVLGGVAPTPWPVPKAAASLVGRKLTAESAAKAADIALQGATPLEHNAYKVPLAKALVRRALAKFIV